MASTLQQAVEGIQLNDYGTRMLADLLWRFLSIDLSDLPSSGSDCCRIRL